MKPFEQRSLVEDLLARGLDDWVDDATVFGNIASRVATSVEDQRVVAVGIIVVAILHGWMEPGDLDEGHGFVAWEASATEAARRIVDLWMGPSEPSVATGDICWLRNTASGDEIGRFVLEG